MNLEPMVLHPASQFQVDRDQTIKPRHVTAATSPQNRKDQMFVEVLVPLVKFLIETNKRPQNEST